MSRRPTGRHILVLESKSQAEFSINKCAPVISNRTALTGQRGAVALPIASTMTGAVKIYFIFFGVLTIAGGIIGYVSKGSVPSIIAGSISGILLLAAGFLLSQHHSAGLILALLISVLLAAQFVPKFFATWKMMPAGMMSILSVLGIVAAVVSWLRK